MAGAIVQAVMADASAASVAAVFPVNVTAGNTIVVFCPYGSGSGNTGTCADTANGSYGTATQTVNDVVDNNTLKIFVKTNTAGGANTVTFTPSGGAANIGICAVEISGVSAIDGSSARQQTLPGTGADQISTATATNTATAFMVALAWATSSTITPATGTGFTSTAGTNITVTDWTSVLGGGGATAVCRLEWKASVAPAANAATFTDPSGGDWVLGMVLLDEAGGGAAPLGLPWQKRGQMGVQVAM